MSKGYPSHTWRSVKLTGRQVKYIREQLEFTQGALGQMIGVSQSPIFRMEKDPSAVSMGPLSALICILASERGVEIKSDEELRASERTASRAAKRLKAPR